MMGHESLQMIHEKYYSHIQNYQRDEGSAFMEKVYNSSINIDEGNGQFAYPKYLKNVPKSYQKQWEVETQSPTPHYNE